MKSDDKPKMTPADRARLAAAARWHGHRAVNWKSECVAIQVRRSDLEAMRRVTADGPTWARFAELIERACAR